MTVAADSPATKPVIVARNPGLFAPYARDASSAVTVSPLGLTVLAGIRAVAAVQPGEEKVTVPE